MRSRPLVAVAVVAAGVLAASSHGEPETVHRATPDEQRATRTASPPPNAQRPTTPAPFRVPSEREVDDPALLASIRRGRAILRDPRDSLPGHVGNALRCTSCHLDDGTRRGVMPWVGVYARFPQYRSRSGTVQLIEDRVDDCLERSLNGRALPRDGRDMTDIVAYLAFLSLGVPVGAEVEGQGLPKLEPLAGDTARGRGVFAAECARCHAADGAGTALAPPVWGPRSFNIGAGMSRLRTAANFVHAAMPYDRPGSLSPRDAFDVAAYVTSRSRPDFARKALDWPNGDPPPDVAYGTRAANRSAENRPRR